ncbi:MAG TPA: hypothetical protein VGJ53_01110 [Micromonosporaceae bacterium]
MSNDLTPVGQLTRDRDNAWAARDVVPTLTIRPYRQIIEELTDMKRLYALALLLAFLVAGCRAAVQPVGSEPTEPPTSPATSAQSASPPASPTAEATDCDVPDDEPRGLLVAIRTEQHADHDRVVFQFDGRQAPNAFIKYVDRVTADPSDKPVALLGNAYVNVVFQGARLDTSPLENDPSQARRYDGPTRLTPRSPLLQELAVSGDFEAVLSFGLGLSDVAGLSTSIPANRGCVLLDVWRTSPNTLLWPVTSVAQAREVQQATKDGHQPWALDAQQVATSYTQHVLGWPQASVNRLAGHVFQADAGAQVAIITLTQPLGRPDTVWAVASVIRSKI